MRIEEIATEVVKTFIENRMSGIIIDHNNCIAVQTVGTSDGGNVIFAITSSIINVVYYNSNTKKSQSIAIVNSHDPDVPGQLKEIIGVVKDDYEDKVCQWPELPSGYESFEPSDWWKYGAAPDSM